MSKARGETQEQQDLLRERMMELMDYDELTGRFTRLKNQGGQKAGTRAGSVNKSNGRRHICVDGVVNLASRLAFLFMTGSWPRNTADHHDLDRLNDRWSNLRDADRATQNRNQGISSRNSSGIRGLSWAKARNKWKVSLMISGKATHLGYFKSKLEAKLTRLTAEDMVGDYPGDHPAMIKSTLLSLKLQECMA